MLKLEQVKNSEKVRVRFGAKNRIFDRPLQRALLYSFLFHALLFGLFRIQYNNLDDRDEVEMAPIQVAIEQEYDASGTIADVQEEHEVQLLPFDQNIIAQFSQFDREKVLYELFSGQKEFRKNEDSSLSQKATIDWGERLYPLHLKLSHALQKLTLIDDGSSSFCLKGPRDSSAEFELATSHYPITYHVTVAGQTGKIVRSSRKKELLDKRLQLLADALLEKIVFRPFEKKEVEGRITVVFHASGNVVEAMIQ